MLGTCTLHQVAQEVHDELLLGEKHILPAVGRSGTNVGHGKKTDGDVLSVDTVHTARSGKMMLILMQIHHKRSRSKVRGQGRSLI